MAMVGALLDAAASGATAGVGGSTTVALSGGCADTMVGALLDAAASGATAGVGGSTTVALSGGGAGAGVSGATLGSAFALVASISGVRLVLRRGRFEVAIVILASFSRGLWSSADRALIGQSVGQPMLIH